MSAYSNDTAAVITHLWDLLRESPDQAPDEALTYFSEADDIAEMALNDLADVLINIGSVVGDTGQTTGYFENKRDVATLAFFACNQIKTATALINLAGNARHALQARKQPNKKEP